MRWVKGCGLGWLVGLTAMLQGGMIGAGCHTAARWLNPCGTLLVCDPNAPDQGRLAWDRYFLDWPDYEADPTCTVPYSCGEWPPAVGSGGTTTTTTTTTTGQTTTGGTIP